MINGQVLSSPPRDLSNLVPLPTDLFFVGIYVSGVIHYVEDAYAEVYVEHSPVGRTALAWAECLGVFTRPFFYHLDVF